MAKGDYQFWDQRRGIIRTKKGGWFAGKGVYSHGYSLMDDIVGKVSYFQSLILNVIGTLPDERVAVWLEALYQCMSFPDSRIWCNQIGALAGTSRVSPMAGITAGILASDSHMYGPGTGGIVYDFLTEAMKEKQNGIPVKTIVLKRSRPHSTRALIPGYGRPLATGDERIAAMERVIEKQGIETGDYLNFAYELEQYLLKTQDESMNLTTYAVAFMMDLNWSLPQMQQLGAIIVTSGVAACYSEALENPPEAFLPLRCEDIDYRGKPPRELPEKE
jgi:citrate synthase